MSNYVISKYNIICEENDGSLLIYNSLERKAIKIPTIKEYVINAILNNDVSQINENDQDFLSKHGVIVEDSCDEQKIADYRYHNIIFASDTLDITILPTNSCNFDCIYCYQNENNNFMTKETADNIIKFVQRKTKKGIRLLSLGWFGGEPMLSYDIVLYIMKNVKKICEDNKVILLSRMTTNGYDLNCDKFNELIFAGVRYFQVTIDGNREIHNHQRPWKYSHGISTYDVVINNLKEITRTKGFFEVGIRINITPSINEKRTEIIDFMASCFTDRRFVMIFEWVRDWGGNKIHDHYVNVSNSSIVIDWIRDSQKRGLRCSDKLLTSLDTHFCESCKLNGCVIDWDAKVYKCAMAIYKSEYQDINLLGSIDEKGEMEINRTLNSKWILPEYSSNCDSCQYYPLCYNMGCPFKRKILKQQACLPYKNAIKDYLRLYNKQNKTIIMS